MLEVLYEITGSKLVDISPVLTGLRGHLQDPTMNWQLEAKAADWQLTMDRMFPYEKLAEALEATREPVPAHILSNEAQREEEVRTRKMEVKRGPHSLADRQAALRAKVLGASQTSVAAGTEVPLSVIEAAAYWGQSPKATRDYFRNIPGVRIIPSPPSYRGGRRKRAYETVLIPPAILLREIDKSTKRFVSTQTPRR